jgi:hypothetical protein
VRCTNSKLVHASANLRMYFRFRGEKLLCDIFYKTK